MTPPKPSGLARFTRQGSTPPPSRPVESSDSTVPTANADAPQRGRASNSRAEAKPKLVGVYLMPDGHRQLKVEAAKRGVTISDVVREAVNAWFTNEGLPPLA